MRLFVLWLVVLLATYDEEPGEDADEEDGDEDREYHWLLSFDAADVGKFVGSGACLAVVGEDEHGVGVGHVVDIEVEEVGILLEVHFVDEVVFGCVEETVKALDDVLVEIIAAILAENLVDLN